MSKGLNSLNEMVIHLNSKYGKTQEALEDFRNIEKELEALEIIKEKKVQVRWLLKDDFLEEYNDDVEKKYRLTLSEFTLLKEVLL